MALIFMMIANYRVFLLQAHPIQLLHHFCVKTNGRPPKLSTKGIQTAVKAIKTLFYDQLSDYANNPFVLSDNFAQSIRLAFHDAGEIDLTNSTNFMGPDGCISDTRPNLGLYERTNFLLLYSLSRTELSVILMSIQKRIRAKNYIQKI